MKWERIKHKFRDGTYWIAGYKLGEFVIRPQYIISNNRPIGYNVYKNDEFIDSRITLAEAKAFVEKKVA